jgi:hypothetical protein
MAAAGHPLALPPPRHRPALDDQWLAPCAPGARPQPRQATAGHTSSNAPSGCPSWQQGKQHAMRVSACCPPGGSGQAHPGTWGTTTHAQHGQGPSTDAVTGRMAHARHAPKGGVARHARQGVHAQSQHGQRPGGGKYVPHLYAHTVPDLRACPHLCTTHCSCSTMHARACMNRQHKNRCVRIK